MSSSKFYAVFKGRVPGIYTSWDECKKQINGFNGASFKSFKSYDEANEVFKRRVSELQHKDLSEEEIQNSISVDASCLGYPGKLEFNIVDTGTGEQIYSSQVYECGEVNLGEFLVLVKSLEFIDKNNAYDKVIFSDSVTAITWVRNKRAKPSIPQTPETQLLLSHVAAAEKYLAKLDLSKYKIVKWDTHIHGEIKADYGRK